jgi:hypothetical protein
MFRPIPNGVCPHIFSKSVFRDFEYFTGKDATYWKKKSNFAKSTITTVKLQLICLGSLSTVFPQRA